MRYTNTQVNRDWEGSFMLHTERATDCVSTPDPWSLRIRKNPPASHEKPKLYQVKQGAQHKDCVQWTVKGQPHANRCSHWHDDALTHANNHAISNFIGGHQLDRWLVNQSLSKQRQFRSTGKPPNKQSATTSAPRQKRKRKKPSQGMSVTYLAVYKDDEN